MTTVMIEIAKQQAANAELIFIINAEMALIRIKLQHLEDKVNHANEAKN